MNNAVAEHPVLVRARPWVAQYPEGVPADVRIDPHMTLVDALKGTFRQTVRQA
jgi:hypothetical protein